MPRCILPSANSVRWQDADKVMISMRILRTPKRFPLGYLIGLAEHGSAILSRSTHASRRKIRKGFSISRAEGSTGKTRKGKR